MSYKIQNLNLSGAHAKRLNGRDLIQIADLINESFIDGEDVMLGDFIEIKDRAQVKDITLLEGVVLVYDQEASKAEAEGRPVIARYFKFEIRRTSDFTCYRSNDLNEISEEQGRDDLDFFKKFNSKY